MSQPESTAKPVICDDCGKEINPFFTVWLCADGKTRCDYCFKVWSRGRVAG